MSKKDYIAIAEAIARTPRSNTASVHDFDALIENLSEVFQRDNAKFNPVRFKAAAQGD